jgi:agmatine deiminase
VTKNSPSSRLRVGIVQMSMGQDVDTNLSRALAGVDEAAKQGADVVCLPELFAWRYFPAARHASATAQRIPGPISEALAGSARENKVILVGGSIFEESGGKRYNTCLVFDQRGRVLSKYRKVHIPQDEHYYEQDYFTPGTSFKVAKTDHGSIGTLVCFDQWYPEAARVLALSGADAIFYPTAIGWVDGIEQTEGDWRSAWEAVQVGHAVANSTIVCAVNRVGREGGTRFWGGSFVCDQFGKVLFRAGEEEGVFVADCDLTLGKQVEDGWGFMRNRKPKTYSRVAR